MQVKVTSKHVAECKKLLTLMGVPFVEVSSNSLNHLASKLFETRHFYEILNEIVRTDQVSV